MNAPALPASAPGVPPGQRTVTPYLVVEEPDALLRFIETAFGGELRSRHEDDTGRVMHAEITVGDSVIMVGGANEAYPPTRALVHLYLPDADAAWKAAIEAGGRSVRDPESMDYGDRTGGVEDPWGTQWWVATPVG